MSHLKLCDRCVSLLALRGCVLLNVSPQTVWPLRIFPCPQGLCIIECLTSKCVTAAYLSLRSGLVYYWMPHLKLCDCCVSLLALRGCVLLNVSPQTVWLLRISPCPQGLCIIECLTSKCVTAAYLSLPSGLVYYWMSHLKVCDRCVSLLALRACVLFNVSPQTVWLLRISPCPQGLCICCDRSPSSCRSVPRWTPQWWCPLPAAGRQYTLLASDWANLMYISSSTVTATVLQVQQLQTIMWLQFYLPWLDVRHFYW